MSDCPVREMVLYKHGVGFFIRQGEFEGDSLTLTFRQDEINDVLKSLAVFDQAGGQILGIHYPTPMDKEHRLANTAIKLSDDTSLRDLLRDLRGRTVRAEFEMTPGTLETVTGRVVGIERNDWDAKLSSINLITDEGVRVLRFEHLRGLKISDAQAEQDLNYFLETSVGDDARRTVTLRLSEGQHELNIYYVAPSPTWRVSYRLVAESDAEQEGMVGQALLQGWGLFDNRLEEDLNEVRVTLVAGQPISFIYDLYNSRIPERPEVKDQARTAPRPMNFASQAPPSPPQAMRAKRASGRGTFARRMASADMEMSASFDDDMPESLAEEPAAFAAAPPRPSGQALSQSVRAAAEGRDAGETFQYVVSAPVTVKRGESALVPILSHEVNYQRELLYNPTKLKDHPVAALRFENNTGLTLERGPVTLVEDGNYLGEAVLPFTRDTRELYLPYAVELGVTVKETRENVTEVNSVTLDRRRFYTLQQVRTQTVHYALQNDTTDAKVVTLETNIEPNWERYDSPEPDEITLNNWRWRVTVPAQSTETFQWQQRRQIQQQFKLESLNYVQLEAFLKQQWLDEALYQRLRGLLDQYSLIEKAESQKQERNAERERLYQEQENLRANLSALQPTGQEAHFRKRILQQLETSQDRLNAIQSEIEAADAQIAEARRAIETMLSELGPDNPT